jgi:protein gp37
LNRTEIEWCAYTWNPVVGCKHGCPYCYARRFAERGLGEYGQHPRGKRFEPRFLPERLDGPKSVRRPSRIFAVSMGDLFGDWVPDLWIGRILARTVTEFRHTFIFLTKNPGRLAGFDWPDNAWVGTTVTNQQDANERIPLLWKCNARVKFVSIEPLIGGIDLEELSGFIDWIIIGAMTGPGAVKPKQDWVQHIIEGAQWHGIPVFLKSNLEWPDEIQQYPEPEKKG